MASNITPNEIDATYPVAGRDNDSQGFRDNFTNIQTNFEAAQAEITDLQEKVVLKQALSGISLNNDMAGVNIKNAVLQSFRELRVDGPPNSLYPSSGAISIDIANGTYHNLPSSTGNISLDFTNWPGTGKYSRIRVQLVISDTDHEVTLASTVSIGHVHRLDFSSNKITYYKTGTYVYEFSTHDGGSTITISDIIPVSAEYREITNSEGRAGDQKGMLAYDDYFIYTCTGDYNSVTLPKIWKRISSGSTW